ncbi:MAG: GumC family protein [Myxococcales bacterium]
MNADIQHAQPADSLTYREVVGRLLHLIKRTLLYWPVFVAFGTIAIAAFFVAPILVPPIYESSTVLLYREVISADTAIGSAAGPTESRRSRNSRLREAALSRATLTPIIAANGLYRDVVEKLGEIEAVERMRQDTRFIVAESDAITISYRGESPQQVVQVIKDLVASTTDQARTYSTEQSQSTVTFLEAQLASSTKELSKAEQSLAEFLSIHPEFALESAATQMGTAIRAGAAREQAASSKAGDPLAALNRQAARLQRRIQDASKPQPTTPVGPPMVDAPPPSVAEAERNLKRAQETLADRLSHYTDKHPDVVAARSQVRVAEQRLVAAREAARAPSLALPATQAPTAIASPAGDGASLDKLKAELNQVQRMILTAKGALPEARKDTTVTDTALNESSGIVELETEWSSLNREVFSARERNDQIQKQLFKASLLAKVRSSGGGQIIVIDEAYVPRKPVTRGKKKTGAAGAGIVMFLGLLTAFVLALTDDRLYNRHDVRVHGIGPIAHTVPLVTRRVREA